MKWYGILTFIKKHWINNLKQNIQFNLKKKLININKFKKQYSCFLSEFIFKTQFLIFGVLYEYILTTSGTEIYKRACLIRAQGEYFASGTTMKVWKLVFLVILSVDTSVADQTRPTLWILVKNWRFFSCFTKNNGFLTFIWVIP